ncbi:MAG: UbiA family prenyltransferase [Candidatus Marinimicrobia bacterium]|nr:UbiA family prenyltransferase [Candidatus Neomarinimicrobiota bacterium]
MKIKIPEKYLKPLDYVYILRPSLFFAVWIITLAGYESGKLYSSGESTWFNLDLNIRLLVQFILITLSTGGMFIWNQLQDMASDKENKKCFLVSENYIPVEIAKKYALVLTVVPALPFLILDLQIFGLLVVLELVWGYFYNFQPFSWKDKPIFGVLANLLAGILLMLIGWKMSGRIELVAYQKFLPYLCAWGAVSMLTTIPDAKGDVKQDKKTIALLVGPKIIVWSSLVLVIFGFVLGMKENDPVITHGILLSFPLYVIASFRPSQIWVLRTIRYSILFLAIFLSVEYPFFFLALGLNYYISRFYYDQRFGLDYPTFHVLEEENDSHQ